MPFDGREAPEPVRVPEFDARSKPTGRTVERPLIERLTPHVDVAYMEPGKPVVMGNDRNGLSVIKDTSGTVTVSYREGGQEVLRAVGRASEGGSITSLTALGTEINVTERSLRTLEGAATEFQYDVSHRARTNFAGSVNQHAGQQHYGHGEDFLKKAGKVGKLAVLGPAGKLAAGAAVVAVMLEASGSAEAAVHKGEMTPAQAQAYKQAAAVGAIGDAVSPIPLNIGADNVRDVLVQQNLSPEARARLQIGDPTSQIGRIRERLPERAEGTVSPNMKKLISLNAEIKNLQSQQYADPSLRKTVAEMEMALYKHFDGMRGDSAARAEIKKATGIPVDSAEVTFVPPPAGLSPEAQRTAQNLGAAAGAHVANHAYVSPPPPPQPDTGRDKNIAQR